MFGFNGVMMIRIGQANATVPIAEVVEHNMKRIDCMQWYAIALSPSLVVITKLDQEVQS